MMMDKVRTVMKLTLNLIFWARGGNKMKKRQNILKKTSKRMGVVIQRILEKLIKLIN